MDPNENLLAFYRRHGFVDSSLHPMRYHLRNGT